MLKDDDEQFFKEMKELREIINKVSRGETALCPKCGAKLVYYDRNSGKHPGIFCPNNDFKTLLDYRSDDKNNK